MTMMEHIDVFVRFEYLGAWMIYQSIVACEVGL